VVTQPGGMGQECGAPRFLRRARIEYKQPVAARGRGGGHGSTGVQEGFERCRPQP